MKKNTININQLFGLPTFHFEKFHKETILKNSLLEELPKSKWPKEWTEVYFKAYGRMKEIPLPRPKLEDVSIKKLLFQRKSTREFSHTSVYLQKLSSLLYFSCGLKNNSPPFVANRFYPSGGARYPLEIYLLSLKTELPTGLYHYYVKNHSLEELSLFNKPDLYRYFRQKWTSRASLFILISAVFKRSTVKYGDRGYRHTLIEAGHVGQNIYLLSEALQLSCCAIGGFSDNELNKLLDIDGIDETVIYAFAIG